jgi:hypothetical protein
MKPGKTIRGKTRPLNMTFFLACFAPFSYFIYYIAKLNRMIH